LLGGLLATACGGQAKSDAFTDDDSGTSDGSGGTGAGGSSSGGSGGSGGTEPGGAGGVPTTAVSVTSGPSSTGTTTTAGGGPGGSGGAPDRCSLPLESGECEAAIPSFGYDSESGRCTAFTYGGCGGNDNRFGSLDDCLAACDPGGKTACEQTTDCVIDHGCCGFCGQNDPLDLTAVNQKYASFAERECAYVDCEYCPPSPDLAPFGARCNAGSCEVYDVRQSPLSECSVNDDCRLRSGLSCCQGCSATQWVAVSDDDLVEKELCGEDTVGCPDCEPGLPLNITTICGPEDHCIVGTID
jgi:hypothetical protein